MHYKTDIKTFARFIHDDAFEKEYMAIGDKKCGIDEEIEKARPAPN